MSGASLTASPAELRAARESISSAGAAALDLHEGIGDKAGENACLRWPAEFRLKASSGLLVKGRCKATNLCLYCAKLAAVENTELLALDALQGTAPAVWMVLTTGTDELDPAAFYAARKHLVKALRREFPDRHIEWAALVEFTRGYSAQSGGRRFPHWNVLLKDLWEADLERIRGVVERVWCGRSEFKATPDAQLVGMIYAHGGLMKYIAMHFQKESQAPPAEWRGHRFLKSRGYLWTDTPTARGEARQALRLKREIHHAEKLGWKGEDALALALEAVDAAAELDWDIVRLVELPTAFDDDGMPSAWESNVFPLR